MLITLVDVFVSQQVFMHVIKGLPPCFPPAYEQPLMLLVETTKLVASTVFIQFKSVKHKSSVTVLLHSSSKLR